MQANSLIIMQTIGGLNFELCGHTDARRGAATRTRGFREPRLLPHCVPLNRNSERIPCSLLQGNLQSSNFSHSHS
jgi:hypothetical protein